MHLFPGAQILGDVEQPSQVARVKRDNHSLTINAVAPKTELGPQALDNHSFGSAAPEYLCEGDFESSIIQAEGQGLK